MAETQWSLHEAKNQFSAVVEAAQRGEPQVVTKRGKRAVVVIAAEQYDRLTRVRRGSAPTFVDQLLAMPTDDGTFDRMDVEARDVEL